MTTVQRFVLLILLVIGLVLSTGCISQTPLQNGSPAPEINPQHATPVPTFCLVPTNNSKPFITINKIGHHHAGDVFEINGTTNFCVGTKIMLGSRELTPLETTPGTQPINAYDNYTESDSETFGNVSILPGADGINFWTYTVNTSGFHPNFYWVNVWNYDPAITPDIRKIWANRSVVGEGDWVIDRVQN
jgi:hypothetical protein